jgi:hypothetical protein
MQRARLLNMPNALGPAAAYARLRGHSYGRLSPARWLRSAPADALSGFERVLVPNWLVSVDVATRRRRETAAEAPVRLVVDCLSGECRAVPDDASIDEVGPVDGFDGLTELVSADEAKRLAAQAMRWQLLRAGGIHLRDLRLSPAQAERAYIPIWLGYFTNNEGRVRVRCLSGTDGTVENAIYAMKVLRMLRRTHGRAPDVAD